jgi:hypothetical protein
MFFGSYHEVIAVTVWALAGHGPTVYQICASCGKDVKAAGDAAFAGRREYVAKRARSR